MTRSNLDRWEDCGEAPQGTSLAQLRSNVLDLSRLKSHARRFRHGAPCSKYRQSSLNLVCSSVNVCNLA